MPLKTILILLALFLSFFANSQGLDSWINKEAENNPEEYLNKANNFIPATPQEVAGNYYVIGRCYHLLNQEDTALKYLMMSKKEFEELNLNNPAKDLALEIHKVISSQENYQEYGTSFLNEYYSYAQKTGSDEKLANAWNEFAKIQFDKFENETMELADLDSAETLYNRALKYALNSKNVLLIAKIYSNLSIVQSYKEDYASARDYLTKARALNAKSGDKYELFSNYFNVGNNFFYEKNYPEAIRWYKKAEGTTIPKFRDKSKRVVYKRLMMAYDSINNQNERRRYQQLYLDLEAKVNDEKQNVAMHDINVKYQVKEKDVQISFLSKTIKGLKKHKIIIYILLFLVFLLALYSFIRWKKVDFRKKKLEAEKEKIQEEKITLEHDHNQVKEELEKVKEIVTQEYIILKDKTKLYIHDLMYIKSDDHYLNAFTNDNKNHLFRGSLSQLQEELPPNFVRCHRSYIINKNYAHAMGKNTVILKDKTQIPASRQFKL